MVISGGKEIFTRLLLDMNFNYALAALQKTMRRDSTSDAIYLKQKVAAASISLKENLVANYLSATMQKERYLELWSIESMI